MPRATVVLFGLAFVFLALPASAQRIPYDPYAAPEAFVPAVNEKGEIHWPTFFKDAKIQKNYEYLWSIGSCQGTSSRIMGQVMSNRMDINALPEASLTGVVSAVAAGSIEMIDEKGTPISVVTHPAGVSRVKVVGDVLAMALKPGLMVRYVDRIDEKGNGELTVSELDIISPSPDLVPKEALPGVARNIEGFVVRLRGDKMQIRMTTGKLRRITSTLDPAAIAHIDSKDLAMSGIGDKVTVKGRVHSSTSGKQTGTVVFASDIDVSKPKAKGDLASNVE